MPTYEPAPGTGWEEGSSSLPGTRRWRLLIGPELYLAVAAGDFAFTISLVVYGDTPTHAVPGPEHLQRVERDFGVFAWSVTGILPALPPSVGQCLCATAVDPRGSA
jgi:hypothetical protein